jgi:hypothetical protein
VHLNHSHRIRPSTGEPRTNSRVPIRGTFANWFVQILLEFAENKEPTSWKREPVKKPHSFSLSSLESQFRVKKRREFILRFHHSLINCNNVKGETRSAKYKQKWWKGKEDEGIRKSMSRDLFILFSKRLGIIQLRNP